MGDTSFSMWDNLKMCPPCGNIQKEFSGKKARVNPSEWIPRMDFWTKNYRFSVSILVNNLVFDLSMIPSKCLCPPRVPHGNGSRSVRWQKKSSFSWTVSEFSGIEQVFAKLCSSKQASEIEPNRTKMLQTDLFERSLVGGWGSEISEKVSLRIFYKKNIRVKKYH